MRIEFQAPKAFELVPRVWIGGAPKATTRDAGAGVIDVGLVVFCAQEYTPTMAKMSQFEAWEHLCLVDDGTPPTPRQVGWMRDALADARAYLDRGETVAITCLAGKNRSCTLGALLLVERGWKAQDAIDVIRRARPGALTNHALNDLILGWADPSPASGKVGP